MPINIADALYECLSDLIDTVPKISTAIRLWLHFEAMRQKQLPDFMLIHLLFLPLFTNHQVYDHRGT